ncbi:hypothetical protein [Mariniphaga anaerophila]|uniref:hypothetical protein n=1 Tax=Mariniphaga anaerophila TaxID=1484053 RepID=UPI000934DDCA|nr:hypothetical protein [Mariniphaga anaerophila]
MLDGFYPEFSLGCAQFARSLKIPVVLDCGSWKPQYETLLENADVVIASEDFYPPGCKNSADVFSFFSSKGI